MNKSSITHHTARIGFEARGDDAPHALTPSALPEPIVSHPLAIDLYLIVTVAIAAALLLSVLGVIVLAIFAIPAPDLLGNLGMAALVALAALLNGQDKGA